MALKQFNKDNVTWCIPKRGTGKKPLPDYTKVMRMKEGEVKAEEEAESERMNEQANVRDKDVFFT